jgi:hypothetical protein
MFFFEKKNQKTFIPWCTPPERLSLMSKSFSFFSEKKSFLAPSACPPREPDFGHANQAH